MVGKADVVVVVVVETAILVVEMLAVVEIAIFVVEAGVDEGDIDPADTTAGVHVRAPPFVGAHKERIP